MTYVASSEAEILGFATVSHGSVEIEDLSGKAKKKLPHYPLPILRLARLATSSAARGLGVGKALLRFVLELALEADRRAGCVGVVVDAKPQAHAFYERFGFEALEGIVEGESPLRPPTTCMFLALGSIPRPAS